MMDRRVSGGRAPAVDLVRLLVVAVLVACCLSSSSAIDIGFGACPQKQLVQNFEPSRYMGKWYEIKKYWQPFEQGGKCITAQYTLSGSIVLVKNTQIDIRSGTEKSIEGTAEWVGRPEGNLAVTFNIPVVGNQTAPYSIVGTDYENYAVVYSCVNLFYGYVKVESAWVLSRTSTVNETINERIDAVITKAEINPKSLQTTVQDCA